MKTFKDLKHINDRGGLGGTQAKQFYSNGFGVSVIRHDYSYGGDKGLYELAVLKGNDKKWTLCYDTKVTSDVIGYLEPTEVSRYMKQVQGL